MVYPFASSIPLCCGKRGTQESAVPRWRCWAATWAPSLELDSYVVANLGLNNPIFPGGGAGRPHGRRLAAWQRQHLLVHGAVHPARGWVADLQGTATPAGIRRRPASAEPHAGSHVRWCALGLAARVHQLTGRGVDRLPDACACRGSPLPMHCTQQVWDLGLGMAGAGDQGGLEFGASLMQSAGLMPGTVGCGSQVGGSRAARVWSLPWGPARILRQTAAPSASEACPIRTSVRLRARAHTHTRTHTHTHTHRQTRTRIC
jgi:hypothetical protein